ncbi:hypothetical protein B0T10DRAFT_449832 [Thelonectria olida]|uniref:BTB domain-containing protein n=1 Tax=Thelonectria olida TaxID=1576542 RepID=A0A9P8VSD0_9HYPO|nr:hypothetical protein B0T10DRAFT_449832 [Thelonectria olida]
MKLDGATSRAIQEALTAAQTGIYSDLTVRCGNKEYPVHKVLACTRFPFLAKACDGPYEEGRSGVIDLSDDDHDAVDSMICYLYNGYYPRIESGTTVSVAQPPGSKSWTVDDFGEVTLGLQVKYLCLHARVYALAEKYAVSGLKEIALRYFRYVADGETCNLEEFSDASELAYTTTIDSDRGLRDVVIKALHENYKALDQDHVQGLLKRHPNLAIDFIMHYRAKQMAGPVGVWLVTKASRLNWRLYPVCGLS